MLMHSHQSYGIYIIRRLARLYPAFLVSLAIGLCVSRLTADTYANLPWQVDDYGQLGNSHTGRHALEQSNLMPLLLAHLTMLHGIFPEEVLPGSSLAFVPPGWSLSLEWQFYLIAPLLIAAFRVGKSSIRLLLLGLVLVFLGNKISAHFTYIVPSFLPLSIGFFLIGIMCAHLYDQLRNVAPKTILYGLILMTIWLYAMLGAACLPYVIWLWSMCASFTSKERILVVCSAWLRWKPLTYFGDRSYGFYLYHQAVLACCAAILLGAGLKSPIPFFVALITMAFLATFALSIVSYRFVELPVIAFVKQRTQGRKT